MDIARPTPRARVGAPRAMSTTYRGAPAIDVRGAEGSRATLTEHGAHVVRWDGPDGDERVFTSRAAVLDGARAIRGGIPICFPQFSDLGPCATSHGFARCVRWETKETRDGRCAMTTRATSEEFKAPHETTYEVELLDDGSMRMTLRVRNAGAEAFGFTTALHTYFRVGDAERTRVELGRRGLTYLDNLDGRRAKVDEGDTVVFEGEVDRIYKSAPGTIRIVDEASSNGPRTFHIEKSESFPDAVVWNPWIEKARKMSDFGDEEYREMVCVEVACVDEIVVAPGSTWVGSQTISVSK